MSRLQASPSEGVIAPRRSRVFASWLPDVAREQDQIVGFVAIAPAHQPPAAALVPPAERAGLAVQSLGLLAQVRHEVDVVAVVHRLSWPVTNEAYVSPRWT